jgi:hypothetical protein
VQDPEPGPSGSSLSGADLVSALAELVLRLDDLGELEAMSEAIAEFAVTALGADLAGVSLRPTQGKPARLATSHHDLTELDRLEETLGEGPGSPRSDGDDVVAIRDTRTDPRWPAWGAAAAQGRVHSVCLIAMTTLGGRRSFTLDLYSRRPDGFVAADDVLRDTARIIGHAVHHIQRRLNLESALSTRDMIGQAQGIVMERYQLDSEQAMQFLRRISQDSHAKIRQIASQLVQGGDPTS